ncbi:kininogen-1-like [Eucalyptus grandis]|uniref:kininogen-1-like n=1 Tax=Eucalyptus grandis TaxID=71139 RepID=UPI00192E7EE2|nr:kininogen-1-like [Eucalyptus grandis]
MGNGGGDGHHGGHGPHVGLLFGHGLKGHRGHGFHGHGHGHDVRLPLFHGHGLFKHGHHGHPKGHDHGHKGREGHAHDWCGRRHTCMEQPEPEQQQEQEVVAVTPTPITEELDTLGHENHVRVLLVHGHGLFKHGHHGHCKGQGHVHKGRRCHGQGRFGRHHTCTEQSEPEQEQEQQQEQEVVAATPTLITKQLGTLGHGHHVRVLLVHGHGLLKHGHHGHCKGLSHGHKGRRCHAHGRFGRRYTCAEQLEPEQEQEQQQEQEVVAATPTPITEQLDTLALTAD